MESNSDEDKTENLIEIETTSSCGDDDDKKYMHNIPNQTRVFYEGKEKFVSQTSTNAAESIPFQKSKGHRPFNRQYSHPSRPSRNNHGNRKRGRRNFRPDSSFQNQNSGNFRSNFSRQTRESDEESSVSECSDKNFQIPNTYRTAYFPNSMNVNRFPNQTAREEDLLSSIDPVDKLLMFRKLKEEYSSMMSSISPLDIIMDYRRQIEEMSNNCTENNLDKIQKINTLIKDQGAYRHIFTLHYDNLVLQQQNFDCFINSMKQDLCIMDDISGDDADDIIRKADRIKQLTENECSLFRRKLPAYGHKKDILNALKDNQVIIISSDSSYFFNTATPIIMAGLGDYSVISCENCNISCEWISHDIGNLIKHRIAGFSNINFMNAEKMLSYLKDGKISGKNCFILNISLKRSITSDLLLATLNEILVQQKDAKLILLLSVFDNVEKYQKYFSSLEVFLLKVPKLLLPVQTVWKKEPLVSKDYKKDVISTILSIHFLNDAGNILAFLPSLVEAKAANAMLIKEIQELKCDNLECFLLHEDSSNILNFKQPLKRNEGSNKRKIFLATHCMEAIPMPSVLYVIDCGLMQDYIFDGNKNLDILTTVFNSRARARLRKSLVGVYTQGICYRIFNKENFCIDMPSYELPDMLILNPFNTLIKIFQYYPKKALSMQFVEPLPDAVKYNTVKQLKNFDAIKDGKLTPQVGEKVVKLPFSARYSKMILLGIQWGLVYEAVVLVAYFSVDSYLFKFTKDEKYQQLIDASKLDLIKYESDPISFLHIYKSWLNNKCSIAWCEKFHIDFNTLNAVKVKISEICEIVYDSLSEKITQEFSDLEQYSTSVLEMLFQCFSDNLCVFSGHYRCGYRILSSRQTAYLHPSTIICNKENLPKLIIYDKITKTSRFFLRGISAIPEEMVFKIFTEKELDYDASDIERRLVPKVIEPVGERIIKQVLLGVEGKKLLEIENLIKEKVKSDYIVIDPSAEKGCVTVYALEHYLEDAVNLVNELLKSNLNDVINAEKVYSLELQKGEMTIPLEVKCGMGAKITSVKVKEKTQATSSRSYSDEIRSEPMKDVSSITYSINLTWVRRPCSGVCFVSFEPKSFMQARKLSMQRIFILNSEASVEVSTRNENELLLCNLSRETRREDVESVLRTRLPGVSITKVELKFIRPFTTTVMDIEEIKMEIQENCEEYTDLIEYDIIVPKPKDSATIMTAYINVSGSEDLTIAAEKLSNTMIREFKVNAIPVYRSVIRVNYKVYKALELRLLEGIKKLKIDLSKIYPDRDLFRFEADRYANTNLVLFKLLSNDMKIMKYLQKTINELLEGEVLSKNQVKDIHKLFCHGGHMWLRTIEKAKKVHIIEEYKSKTIRVYGSRESCFKVKECILNFLQDTENEAVETIVLSNDKSNRILMKSLIKKYTVHLESFIDECQLRSAELDIKTCRLLLHGSRDSIEKARELLNSFSEANSMEEFSVLSGGELCPVCACSAFNLTVRLQHCNHLYCRECISNLVEQAKFPIQCCADNCSEDIVLDDIVKILDEDDAKIKKLLHSSLNNYLEQNRSEIFYCPAPDCPMFAYKSELTRKWVCPLCRNEICTNCNVIYHYGFTCDVYQGSKRDPNYSFKVWKQGTTECKDCPNCKTAIEKNEGCDHMTCISCKAHFCWVCCREFPTATAVYNHIPFCDQYPKW